MPEENSVLFAIRELAGLEEDRVAAEEAERREAAEAEARAAQEAVARAAEAEAEARRRAEAEARYNVDRELEQRDAEAEQRMATLRAELAAVQADRARMHARIVTIAEAPDMGAARARESWGWKAAFVSAGVVAAGLAVILAVRQPVIEARIIEVPVTRAPAAAAPTDTPTSGALGAVAEAAPSDLTEVTPAAGPEAPAQVRRVRTSPTASPSRVRMAADPLGDLDCPDDDPTCGI